MDIAFIEPTLEIIELRLSQPKKAISEFLVSKLSLNLYRKYIEKGVLEYNKHDLDTMNLEVSRKLEELNRLKEESMENEPYVLEIEKKICEFYAKIYDLENFEKLAAALTEKDNSTSLKMNILMCKIRLAIILEDRASLVKNIENAKFVFEVSSDWETKNKFKVYLGLFYLMKAEFEKSAEYFCDSLASFNAYELLPFEKIVLYLVFSSLLSFERNRLKSQVIDNPEIRKCQQYLELPECLFDCAYSELFRKILKFVEYCESDYFLDEFKENFCKEMKIKGYYQLLLCYQSLHLDKMGQYFDVETEHVEEDLRNFIVEKKLNCIIDRIDGMVRMSMAGKGEDLECLMKMGDNVLRDIMKSIN